ncbi:MAG: lytic transglycosylase domain-containing protein [Acidobacteriota bacterium]|nr:lytic transglycosylase domain-containing protein [Acidobacteriota bacterium]
MKGKAAIVAVLGCCLALSSLHASGRTAGRFAYQQIIERVAGRHNLPSELIHAIIVAESNYNRYAVSPKGASGLMQLMPDTARHYGVKNVFDPEQNIEGGARYLKDLIQMFDADTKLVLAAYNAGQQAVIRHGGIPPYRETRDYVKRITASYTKTTIHQKSRIYKIVDSEGRVTLTNDPRYFRLNTAGRTD